MHLSSSNSAGAKLPEQRYLSLVCVGRCRSDPRPSFDKQKPKPLHTDGAHILSLNFTITMIKQSIIAAMAFTLHVCYSPRYLPRDIRVWK